MGKRSSFDRIGRDFYRTFDTKAGKALEPFLEDNYTYAEPFCGSGDLIKQLRGDCLYASDIEPDEDNKVIDMVFETKSFTDVSNTDIEHCQYIITNPPWDRKILHETIEFFANKKPTWLLFDSNWMFTKQSIPYINKYCLRIVTVGRMIWIPDTKMTGKDDVCWYLFSSEKTNESVSFTPRII